MGMGGEMGRRLRDTEQSEGKRTAHPAQPAPGATRPSSLRRGAEPHTSDTWAGPRPRPHPRKHVPPGEPTGQQPTAVPAAASRLVLLFKPILWEQGFPDGSVGKEFACNAGDLIPGSRRAPGGGNGYPLQYSCLGNPMVRGAWWATVHRPAKSQTRSSYWTQGTCVDKPLSMVQDTAKAWTHMDGGYYVEGSTPISGRMSGQSPHSSDGTSSLPLHNDKVEVHFWSRQNACFCNTDSVESLELVGSQRR